jgi:ABC-type uncharacterized transport system permease subunit
MSLLWLRVAVLMYGVAALAVLPAALYDRPRWRLAAVPAIVVAVFFHFVSLAEMLNAAHHRLPVEAHELQSVLALILAVGFLVIYAIYRSVAIGVFVFPIVFLLGMLAAFRPGEETFTVPVRTGWIFTHILLLLGAYAALVVSLGAGAGAQVATAAGHASRHDRPDWAAGAVVRAAVHDGWVADRVSDGAA